MLLIIFIYKNYIMSLICNNNRTTWHLQFFMSYKMAKFEKEFAYRLKFEFEIIIEIFACNFNNFLAPYSNYKEFHLTLQWTW